MDLSEAVFWGPIAKPSRNQEGYDTGYLWSCEVNPMFSRRRARNYDSSVRCPFDCAMIGLSYKDLPKTGVVIYKLAI